MKKILRLIPVLLFMTACATISNFDQTALINVTSLKVDVGKTMDLAVNDYDAHAGAVDSLKTKIDKAYEYEKYRPKNTETIKQWDVIRDANGHSLYGFLEYWKNQKKLNSFFIEQAKGQVWQGFDIIANLESAKIKR